MDDASPERNWLDDRLKHLDGGHGHFTVVNSPLRPVVERGDPWKVDVRHHELKAFVDHLQPPAEEGARVAVVTDVEEDPVARVQTAVLVGRRMAEKGSRVLIVDADVRHVGLSRWASDQDLDAEGLVDVLQYGASVSAVRRHGPVEGVDVVGVGSYRPDDADLFTEDDLLRLVAQLRGEADVVLILAPARIGDDRFHPLLVHADSVIVSLHLDRSLGARLQELLEYLQGLNVPVAGLMTYAGPDAAERRIDDVFDVETAAPQESIDTEHREADEPLDERPETPPEGPSEGPVPFAASLDRELAAEDEDVRAEEWAESRPRALEPPASETGGSSTVFRVVAVIALVGLVAFIGWWGLSSRDDAPPVDVAGTPPPVVEDEVPAVDASAGEGVEEPAAADDEAVAEPAEGPGEIPPTPPVDGDDQPGAEEPTAGATATGDDEEFPEPEPVETEPALADWERDVSRAVGPGYALHVASFGEESAALGEVQRLASAHGWQPDVRSAVIDGEEWYRVLVGRFDSRADALAARAPIGDVLGLDWVGVVRVR